jgi:RimJ/RimL family protein N-acetyltransferase
MPQRGSRNLRSRRLPPGGAGTVPIRRAKLEVSAPKTDPPPVLYTERLRLDPISPGDGAEFLALFRDEGVRRFLLDDRVVDPGWVAREIEASRQRFAAGSVGLFVARLRGSQGAVAGIAGLRPYHAGELQILYAVDPAAAGRGLASEMVGAVLDYCFDLAEMPRVRATIDAPNRASLKLVERLGFRLVGRDPSERYELFVFEIDAATWRHRSE